MSSAHHLVCCSTRVGPHSDTSRTLTGHRHRGGGERGRPEPSTKADAPCRSLPLPAAQQETGGGGSRTRALCHPAENVALNDGGAAGWDRREAKTIRGDQCLSSDELYTFDECCILNGTVCFMGSESNHRPPVSEVQ